MLSEKLTILKRIIRTASIFLYHTTWNWNIFHLCNISLVTTNISRPTSQTIAKSWLFRPACVAMRFWFVAGWWSDEAVAAFMVRHVSVRPPASEDAQRLAGRDYSSQRPEVRPSLPGTPRRPLVGWSLQRAPEQTSRAQIRCPRLHMRQIFASIKPWLVFNYLFLFNLIFILFLS